MDKVSKEALNSALVKVLNETLLALDADYKDVASALYYSDNAYINRVLNNKKIMTVATLTNICNALIEIKNRKNINIKDEMLKPGYFLSLVGH